MSRNRFITLSIIVDAVAYNAAVMASFLLWFGVLHLIDARRYADLLPGRNVHPYYLLAPILTVVFITVANIYGLYDPERIEGFWQILRGAFATSVLSTLLTLGGLQLSGGIFDTFPRSVIVIAAFLQMLFLIGWRIAALRLTPIRWPEQRVLIVGTGGIAAELADHLAARSKWGFQVLGLVAREEDEPLGTESPAEGGLPVLGTVHDLTELVEQHDVDRVIVASPVALRELVEDITLKGEADVRVDVVPELYEIFIGSVDSIVSDIPLMEITHRSPQWYSGAKRCLDIAGSIFLLIVLSPVMLLSALAILATTGSPVFFRQERVGHDLLPFKIIKFRTMVRDAEAASGPVLASEQDPRVTPLGRFLRTYRLDELPQLFNIVVGEMSFVGPRPERPFFVQQYLEVIPGYRERFRMKPGVAGLAQVSGSYATTPERKLKYDLIYMYHQNLLMDVQIVVDTVRVVLTGHGAR